MVAFELCKAGPGLVILMIFHHNSNLTEILFYCNSVPCHQIATNFCTCHDSSAVMACAKFCSNYFITCWLKTKFCDKFELWRKNISEMGPTPISLLKKAYQMINQISFIRSWWNFADSTTYMILLHVQNFTMSSSMYFHKKKFRYRRNLGNTPKTFHETSPLGYLIDHTPRKPTKGYIRQEGTALYIYI